MSTAPLLNGVTLTSDANYSITVGGLYESGTLLAGTITNNGRITLIAVANAYPAGLEVDNAATLTGSGIVVLAGGGAELIGNGTLTNQQTVQSTVGGGLIEVNKLVKSGPGHRSVHLSSTGGRPRRD